MLGRARHHRRALFGLLFATVLLGATALPGFAAKPSPGKVFVLSVTPGSAASGSHTTFFAKVQNKTPGNSNANSFIVTLPTGITIDPTPAIPAVLQPNGVDATSSSNLNLSATVSWSTAVAGAHTVAVQFLDPLKQDQVATVAIQTVVKTITGCSSETSPEWTAKVYTGSSLSGDQFFLPSGSVFPTTSITTSCTTITATKFNDVNLDGSHDPDGVDPDDTADDEGILTSPGFSFTLNSSPSQTASTVDGVATFDPVVAGSYEICETSIPTGWSSTSGDANGCVSVSTDSPNIDFGNAQDASITVTKYEDVNVNRSRDEGEALLAGWDFAVYASGSEEPIATDATDEGGQAVFSLPAGAGLTYAVCETDARIDQSDEGWETNGSWFSTDPGTDPACKSVTTTSSGQSASLEFGNAEGILGCDDENNSLIDGDATVTRVENTDLSEPCQLKPASLEFTDTTDGDSVTFLVTGTEPAAYLFDIEWGPVANENPVPADVVTEVDLRIEDGVLVTSTHDMLWCVPDGADLNDRPDLPVTTVGGVTIAEVACLISQNWSIVDATHIQKTEQIYAEADLVLSCRKCG